MTDKNDITVNVGDYVRSKPLDSDVDKIIRVNYAPPTGRDWDTERLSPQDPAVLAELAEPNAFEGGGGGFGGAGASGTWRA